MTYSYLKKTIYPIIGGFVKVNPLIFLWTLIKLSYLSYLINYMFLLLELGFTGFVLILSCLLLMPTMHSHGLCLSSPLHPMHIRGPLLLPLPKSQWPPHHWVIIKDNKTGALDLQKIHFHPNYQKYLNLIYPQFHWIWFNHPFSCCRL